MSLAWQSQKKQLPKSVIDNEFNFIKTPISSLNLIALKKQDVIILNER
jgi:hypothetical protein